MDDTGQWSNGDKLGGGMLIVGTLAIVTGLFAMCGEGVKERDTRLEAEADAARFEEVTGKAFAIRTEAEASLDLSFAREYDVLDIEEFPSPSTEGRYRLIIYSGDAKTLDQRAQTAIKAAIDFQGERKAFEVQVWLEALPRVSERVAIADYFPYGISAWGNKSEYIWLVSASENDALLPYLPEYWRVDNEPLGE